MSIGNDLRCAVQHLPPPLIPLPPLLLRLPPLLVHFNHGTSTPKSGLLCAML